MDKTKTLIVIAGPTAGGKTAAGIALAQKLGTEIISADSRQFYREMSIGTAKPTPEELAQAKHHFIGSHSIHDSFNVGDFEQHGLALLDELFKKHDTLIMVGGSGLYVKAICEGFDQFPDIDPDIRERMNSELAQMGIAHLQERLKEVDPDYYAQVDINNPQRIIRALEVFEGTGKPFSSFRKAASNPRPFNIIKYGILWPREELYNRINRRVDLMIEAGLIDEVKSVLPYRHLNALNTVGYSEIFDYLDGRTDLPTAIEAIKQNTRRFAKRQMTWFNKDKEIKWVSPDELTHLY
ncbi:tRNA (adenosine(37)-N6)-dimethylallyltransferase MiaA [Mucilaginibacter myungsuensis]|uniref:tRNA dimethylallyltransferase n=1 Tax=Mucilaginibacter myungsuensis TaxID=649104 RepID=A0A929KVK1_9SPHI|nr:tRNA (adenosine(37)-N6)-dimethylallyltransferase MiaA [Mucilaginibacter myungsuensis]MBE9662396.1 tRNA (adenosine(37)-N6)-dimethylallyltransferase MiaA [Mucilaginibacter myungsuensis]MDN3599167.1 tRNA (adenosine(37)-N6)-dimethylallyltransferase MiaA [Mucilaginibacter myungsuensis]